MVFAQEFVYAVQQRFALIDVAKTQAVERKGKEPALDLHNEIKIITSSDETFALWSELISSYAQGELIDPDTRKKFKENKYWVPQKDGILNREFFKWLGNMTEADHVALLKHMLNRSGPKRVWKYPKVTMKQVSSVLESCYTAKEWIERRKRKHLVRTELHNLKPSLGLFNNQGEFVAAKWKLFKKEDNFSSAMMNVLLEAPGDDFCVSAKQVRNKNKNIEELSPYALEFFKVFLRQKQNFKPPIGNACFRSFNRASNHLGHWLEDKWEDAAANLKLGIINFRRIPG